MMEGERKKEGGKDEWMNRGTEDALLPDPAHSRENADFALLDSWLPFAYYC